MAVPGEHQGSRLGAPARHAGDAVGRVAHQRQVVRDRLRADAELVAHAGLVQGDVPPAVEADDPVAGHELRHVLVRRADDDLVDVRLSAPARGGGGDGVVGLELDHRPHDDAQGGGRPLRRAELRLQLPGDALARLVAVEEVVAERLDHRVEGARHVRHVVLPQQREQRLHQPAHRADRPAVGRARWRRAEVRPEELVRAVDQVYFHNSVRGGLQAKPTRYRVRPGERACGPGWRAHEHSVSEGLWESETRIVACVGVVSQSWSHASASEVHSYVAEVPSVNGRVIA